MWDWEIWLVSAWLRISWICCHCRRKTSDLVLNMKLVMCSVGSNSSSMEPPVCLFTGPQTEPVGVDEQRQDYLMGNLAGVCFSEYVLDMFYYCRRKISNNAVVSSLPNLMFVQICADLVPFLALALITESTAMP
ncbi:uncharacterized protein LOC110023225 [Phalaenopsis equestris]|uniref:uncharacterized protein LOC110023225 n=1 Tax=Phalaenopsis equestris TaxID=78828 RepID=UPI0009E5DAA7|nr:uncharacterized protein LOC110023225 [Phalaenopsis equestris]XP_020578193.1 uncharacterized protein LOC110023225 [Phalaenopsis equestris]